MRRALGPPAAPEHRHWAIAAILLAAAFPGIRGTFLLVLWKGRPPTIEPWLQSAVGVLAVVAAVGFWRNRGWARWMLLGAAAAWVGSVVSAILRYLEKQPTPHELDVLVIAWGSCVVLAILLGLGVRWFWRRTPVRGTAG